MVPGPLRPATLPPDLVLLATAEAFTDCSPLSLRIGLISGAGVRFASGDCDRRFASAAVFVV